MRKRTQVLLPFAIIAAVLLAALIVIRSTPAQTTPVARESSVSYSESQLRQIAAVGNSVRIYRQRTWSCQGTLGVTKTRAERKWYDLPVSQAYRNWVRDLWSARHSDCRKAVARRTFPVTNDWVVATAIVQRAYPGTRSWLLSCSGAEGGHGGWVWYGGRGWTGHHIGNDFLGMDTVGGWLQFRFSTFAPYWRWAQQDLRDRGFVVPVFSGRYDPWLSPLAQALTGGYMRYYGKDGHHWSASWGRGC